MELERKALIVDDDIAIRLLLARILRGHFETDVARDGGEAIEKISAHDYSIILLDLMMPRVDGIAVVRYLDSYRPEVLKRVIILTAWGATAYQKVCPPVARFLEKPFNVDDLMREVAACCSTN